MNFLSRIEEILLLTIWKLKDNAYGISIREQVEKETGMEWLSGAIYGPLGRLKNNGYVKTKVVRQSSEMGGRPRIYYTLSPLGQEKLASIQKLNKTLWAGIPDVKEKVYDYIKDEINKGGQVYFIYPLIEKSENMDLENVEDAYKELSKTTFKDFKVGMVHGRTKTKERDEIL